MPLTSDRTLFVALADKGASLAALHLTESPDLEQGGPSFNVGGTSLVEKVRYDEAYQLVYINEEQFFTDVEPEVWRFQIGG